MPCPADCDAPLGARRFHRNNLPRKPGFRLQRPLRDGPQHAPSANGAHSECEWKQGHDEASKVVAPLTAAHLTNSAFSWKPARRQRSELLTWRLRPAASAIGELRARIHCRSAVAAGGRGRAELREDVGPHHPNPLLPALHPPCRGEEGGQPRDAGVGAALCGRPAACRERKQGAHAGAPLQQSP